MDQLKDALAVIKKYHFWILCGLILIGYLGMWFLAISDMKKETNARVSNIDSSYSKAQSIMGVSNHPNSESEAMMQQLNLAEAEQVRKAWNYRFGEQNLDQVGELGRL